MFPITWTGLSKAPDASDGLVRDLVLAQAKALQPRGPVIQRSSLAVLEEARVLVMLVHNAVQQFSARRQTSRPDFCTLVNILFDHHFRSTLIAPTTSDDPKSQALIDCLLYVCDRDLHEAIRTYELELGYLSIQCTTLPEPPVDCDHDGGDEACCRLFVQFCAALKAAYNEAKQLRLGRAATSPMPWSAKSRKTGIPPPPGSFDGKQYS